MRKNFVGMIWILAICFLFFSLTGCDEYIPALPLAIKSVTPVNTLPALPERAATTLRNYDMALGYASELKLLIETTGGQFDIAAGGEPFDCQEYFELYQDGAALPVLTSAQPDDALLVWAAEEYNTVLANILEAGRGTYNHCEAFLLGKATHIKIAPLAWTHARLGVTESVAQLDAIIKRMREELPDPTNYIGVGGEVLKVTREALDVMGDLGYEIDKRFVICPTFITKYEQMLNFPEINVTGTDETVQVAYKQYRWAVDETVNTTRDLYLDCQDIMTTGLESRSIPFLTWGTARKGLADAMTALHQVESWLGEYAK